MHWWTYRLLLGPADWKITHLAMCLNFFFLRPTFLLSSHLIFYANPFLPQFWPTLFVFHNRASQWTKFCYDMRVPITCGWQWHLFLPLTKNKKTIWLREAKSSFFSKKSVLPPAQFGRFSLAVASFQVETNALSLAEAGWWSGHVMFSEFRYARNEFDT